jgi:hypothetical protein
MSSPYACAAGLHGPRPTAAEELAGEYADEYEIYREIGPGGTHGDWIAKRWPIEGQQDADRETLRAATIDGLRDILGGQR